MQIIIGYFVNCSLKITVVHITVKTSSMSNKLFLALLIIAIYFPYIPPVHFATTSLISSGKEIRLSWLTRMSNILLIACHASRQLAPPVACNYLINQL